MQWFGEYKFFHGPFEVKYGFKYKGSGSKTM